MLLAEQSLQLLRDAVARPNVVADIGPVESGDDQAVGRDAELDEDVLARLPIGRRGEGEAGDVLEAVEQWPQQPIVWPEVMAPFRDALGLVHRDEGEWNWTRSEGVRLGKWCGNTGRYRGRGS